MKKGKSNNIFKNRNFWIGLVVIILIISAVMTAVSNKDFYGVAIGILVGFLVSTLINQLD